MSDIGTACKFSIILADCPWRFEKWSYNGKRGQGIADDHYPTMTVDEIRALPVGDLAARDCALFLWVTWPKMDEAMRVIEAWGFRYRTVGFVWAKTNRTGWGFYMGMGYWTRANTEVCLLAVRGQPKRVSKSVRQLIVHPVMQHSRKPDEVHDRIVQLMGDLPRVELFARRPAPGWVTLGNGIDGRDIREAIAALALQGVA